MVGCYFAVTLQIYPIPVWSDIAYLKYLVQKIISPVQEGAWSFILRRWWTQSSTGRHLGTLPLMESVEKEIGCWEDSAIKPAPLGASGVSFLSVSMAFSSVEHVCWSVTYKLKVLIHVSHPPPTQMNICCEIFRGKEDVLLTTRPSPAQTAQGGCWRQRKRSSYTPQALAAWCWSTCLW